MLNLSGEGNLRAQVAEILNVLSSSSAGVEEEEAVESAVSNVLNPGPISAANDLQEAQEQPFQGSAITDQTIADREAATELKTKQKAPNGIGDEPIRQWPSRGGLTSEVQHIKDTLELDQTLKLVSALREANTILGLQSGGDLFAQGAEIFGVLRRLEPEVQSIKETLEVDQTLSLRIAIREANSILGLPGEGDLRAQSGEIFGVLRRLEPEVQSIRDALELDETLSMRNAIREAIAVHMLELPAEDNLRTQVEQILSVLRGLDSEVRSIKDSLELDQTLSISSAIREANGANMLNLPGEGNLRAQVAEISHVL
jgi:hypothetical protein